MSRPDLDDMALGQEAHRAARVEKGNKLAGVVEQVGDPLVWRGKRKPRTVQPLARVTVISVLVFPILSTLSSRDAV